MLLFPNLTRDAVGLDISERIFRLVEIGPGPFYRRKLHVRRYAEDRLAEGFFTAGEFSKPDEAAARIKNLFKKAYGRQAARGAVVSLPETRTFIKLISLKKPAAADELPKAIAAEAELHIPTPMVDLYFDWQFLRDPASVPVGRTVDVMIGAAPKRVVDAYLTVLDAAGVVPIAFEIEAQAIVRTVIPRHADANRAVGLIDFGASRSSLIVYDKGTIQFTVSIPLSGDAISRRLAAALKIDFDEAERTKRRCGVDEGTCGPKLWRLMEPFMKEMTDRLGEAIEFYRDHFPNGRPLSELILCGGGANMAAMDAVLSRMLEVPVRKADPWTNLEPGRTPLPPDVALSSTTAIGLALRQASPERRAARPTPV